jgi:hypothetical protein
MEEKTTYVAQDGSEFNDKTRCLMYERLSQSLQEIPACENEEVYSIHSFITETIGETRLNRALACLYWSSHTFGLMPESEELLPPVLRQKELRTWRDNYNGIARAIVDLPEMATKEEIGSLIRQYSSDLIATALSTLEDSPIPLSTYKAIKKYLYLD